VDLSSQNSVKGYKGLQITKQQNWVKFEQQQSPADYVTEKDDSNTHNMCDSKAQRVLVTQHASKDLRLCCDSRPLW